MSIRPVVITAALIAAVAATTAAAAPTTAIQFEPETCSLNLAPSYPAAPNGFISTAIPSDGLVTCPPGITPPSTTDDGSTLDFYLFSSQLNLFGPQLRYTTSTWFDASQNAVLQDTAYQLSNLTGLLLDYLNAVAGSKTTPQAVFDRVVNASSGGIDVPAYVTDPTTGKNYRLVLRQPVQITPTTAGSATCTISLAKQYAWTWNSPGYWVIPDSAVSCPGGAFSSAAYTVWLQFNSRLENQAVLYTASRDVYNPSTKNYSKVFELRLANNTDNLGSVRRSGGGIQVLTGGPGGLIIGGGNAPAPTPTAGPVWGRFTPGTSTSPEVSRDGFAFTNGVPSRQYFQVALNRPSIAIKRATTVKLKARAAGAGTFRLSITADRNASFENVGVGPTYRRQTVLSNTPADHAVVKRGSKVLRRVKLSPYGTASITLDDVPGRNPYTVTMVETDQNFAGTARLVR